MSEGVKVEDVTGEVDLSGNVFGTIVEHASRVPCTQMFNVEMQMVLGGEEEAEASELGELRESDDDLDPDPLSSIHPEIVWPNNSSDWVSRKVDEIKECVGISCRL